MVTFYGKIIIITILIVKLKGHFLEKIRKKLQFFNFLNCNLGKLLIESAALDCMYYLIYYIVLSYIIY